MRSETRIDIHQYERGLIMSETTTTEQLREQVRARYASAA
jgi:hypothetical protein